MFDFLDTLSPMSKGLIAATAALGVGTLVSRHFDKQEALTMIQQADAEVPPQQVVDPTVPMQPQAAAAAGVQPSI